MTKTVNGVKTYYQYSGDKLQYQEKGEQKLYFWYDAFGCLSKVYCDYGNGSAGSYLVVCNSRGDVDSLYTVTGELRAKYTYDSWGNTISITDANGNEITSPNHIGNLNPIRYRGYYLDTETGLYYLQSRYYNPTVGRFLNADVYCDTGTSILGTNMFAYCENNPICLYDSDGEIAHIAIGIAIGATVGAVSSAVTSSITQYVNDGEINWIIVGVNAGAGAISGGLSASGIGLLASVGVNAGLGGLTNVLETWIKKDDFSLINFGSSVVFGGISGATGYAIGSKTSPNILTNNYKTYSSSISREAGRANTKYAQKAISYAEQAIGKIMFEWYRTFLSVIIGAVITALHPTERERL